MTFSTVSRHLMLSSLLIATPAWAQVEPNKDRLEPNVDYLEEPALPGRVPGSGFAALVDRSKVTFNATYYGRVRDGKNSEAANQYYGDINTNVLGLGIDLKSGYAWDIIGFDLSAYTNIGQEHGQSELLNNGDYSRTTANGLQRGESYAAVNQAALKLKLGDSDLGMETRGGYTPIRIGTLGTSGGLHSHSYRGFEAKGFLKGFELGYGWADQFHNEWDTSFRGMTNRWDQNRSSAARESVGNADTISYVHSIGGRYAFGLDKAGFVDVGAGEGKDFRKNAQIAASYPIKIDSLGILTTTGYGYWGKYEEKLGSNYIAGSSAANEYHVSFSTKLNNDNWSAMIGYGYTHAPDSWEQQFRMTPWGNSDNRNFIQTWGQIDDFVWDGQSVVKISGTYQIGKLFALPGLEIGSSLYYAWGMENRDGPNAGKKGKAFEVDYKLIYTVQEGSLKGLSAGVYAGNLRYNDFDGKNDRDDVKVIVAYSFTFDTMEYLSRKK